MKRFVITLMLVLLNICAFGGTYYFADQHAYKRGIWDGAKMIVEGCYENREDGAAVLNGDTGHALICQGVDTGVVNPTQGIQVLRPPRAIEAPAGQPESDEEIKKKLKDPTQT